jgi:transposase
MPLSTDHPSQTATQANNAMLAISLELSRSTWLVTALLPGREKMSQHSVKGGDGPALIALIERLKAKAAAPGVAVRVITIQEAGLDGFWIHRLLEAAGIESHVVDAASIAAPRRRRRAKTDGIDGETLLRVLLAWLRREPRVCSMVRPPSPEEEDRRRLSRERGALIGERIREVNRVRGLLAGQGVRGYDPVRRDRRARLEALKTGDGRELPRHLKAELVRLLDRIELLVRQIRDVEAERDALMQRQPDPTGPLLTRLKGIGAEFATVLQLECFFRTFANRRQIAAYAGLAATPWRSGAIQREHGVGATGNPRLRTMMVELAWLWLRYQPGSALSQWFHKRVGDAQGRGKRTAIVAMARKLLVALWQFATLGIVPEGAEMKAA